MQSRDGDSHFALTEQSPFSPIKSLKWREGGKAEKNEIGKRQGRF